MFSCKFVQNDGFRVISDQNNKKEVYKGRWIIFETFRRYSENVEIFIDYRPFKGNPQISINFQRGIP